MAFVDLYDKLTSLSKRGGCICLNQQLKQVVGSYADDFALAMIISGLSKIAFYRKCCVDITEGTRGAQVSFGSICHLRNSIACE